MLFISMLLQRVEGCVKFGWTVSTFNIQNSHMLTTSILKEWVGTGAQQHVNKVSVAAKDSFMQRCAASFLAHMVDLSTSL